MKIGFVVCSRINSNRIKRKCLVPINGVPLIQHLIKRLCNTSLEVIVAVPSNQEHQYAFLKQRFKDRVHFVSGYDDDPLARMYQAAKMHDLDIIIRVCHDKIFIDKDLVYLGLQLFQKEKVDYLYSSQFTDGTGFEIISFKALEKAVETFENVEHITYAIRAVTTNYLDMGLPSPYRSDHRLLIDYPVDLDLMNAIFYKLGNEASLLDVLSFLNNNKFVSGINRIPSVTVYTCAYNASPWIDQCIESVVNQIGFQNLNYLLIDDCSTDDTFHKMNLFARKYPNIRIIRNKKNVGLAASSNIALKENRSKYILRLDADDYLPDKDAIDYMLSQMKEIGTDVIYPGCYYGSTDNIQPGHARHHIGGALFNARSVLAVMFSDELRHYEGLDFFNRAKDILKIGYVKRPIFFYRQHDKSMSKTDLEERERVLQSIELGNKKHVS